VGVPRITTAFWRYDRTQPLIDGRVGVQGAELDCTILRPEESIALAFGAAPYDLTEISLSNTITTRSLPSGRDFPYWLLPVFPSRSFRHGALFVRSDSGIAQPSDLAGMRVGLQEYDMTAAVVLRGVLRDEYGVDTRSIHWRVGERERTKPLGFPLPEIPEGLDFRILPPGTSLEARMLEGELDAIISLREPAAAADGRIRRLFADPEAAERDWFGRKGVFPIMHALALKKSLVEKHPDLPLALYHAFCEAKQLAVSELEIVQAPKVTLPWGTGELRRTRALMGDDFWPYGLAANGAVLDTQLRWSREDGLQARPVTIEELFAPATLAT